MTPLPRVDPLAHQVIDEHASLVRAHRTLLSEKRSLRQAVLDVQERRSAAQEDLRGANREHMVSTSSCFFLLTTILHFPSSPVRLSQALKEEHDETSGVSDFLSNLEVEADSLPCELFGWNH
jgi:hypothetical protein